MPERRRGARRPSSRSGSPAVRAAAAAAGERPRSGPPRAFWPHLRSALRELFTQRASGWRMGVLVAVIVVGLLGGQAIADAVGVRGGWAVAGVQAALVVVVTVAVAVVVAYGRWQRAGRR